MINRFILSALLAAAGLASAGPLAAQDISSPFEFVETSQGIYAYGTYIFTDRGAIGIGPHSGPAAGLGYGIRISGPFVLDTRVAYFPTSRTVYDVDPTADSAAVDEDPMVGLTEVGEADLSMLMIDASLRFDITGPRTWHRLQPYALIGVGGVLRVASDNSAEEQLPSDIDLRVRFRNGVTGHVGAGVEWHLAEHVTVRLDARDLLWKTHIPQGFLQPGRLIDTEEWVQTAQLGLGLGIRF